ncbi:uncharacterized protein F5891DRAFT_982041 [Suillus fuscotomentosus]|uniref:Uncharacterized protein n=1 Tax=Suillus fuscotomentosus TaxID=1912939 RepID=A0AAD4E4F9_9AGAM|nr:uncharacterized protein F5891DRAFT_982041 [Suillus fuscotomentosus]KAG1898128.1 hypothetical protein F5891DRAFT_982041 [Suillus fuscotomentosus]
MHQPDNTTSQEKTPFEQAWEEYRTTIKSSQTKKVKFIERCSQFASEWRDPVIAINEAITEVEGQHSQKQSQKVVSKYLLPFVDALEGFTGIVDALSEFYARPTLNPIASIVWGCLKSLGQCARLFENIHYELDSLGGHLKNIAVYGDLYQKNADMQEVLCNAYINVIRFWYRVDKECTKSGLGLKFGTPFSTKKLGGIINDMHCDPEKIKDCTGRLGQQESREYRQANEAARRESDEAHKWDIVSDWLSSDSKSLNDLCFAQQEENLRGRSQITCQWLFSHDNFSNGGTIPRHHRSCGSMHLSLQQTLSILARQLLEYRQRLQKIPDELQKLMHAPESPLGRAQKIIKALIEGHSRIYFFLDGLDEETTTKSSWNNVVLVLRFLVKLADDYPTKVRVWCSSQRRDRIIKEFQGRPSLDIDGYARSDLALYLSEEVSKLQWSSPSDQACILETLRSRAECSFIWAKLMIDALEAGWSTARMEELLKGLPETLEKYYHRFFERMERFYRPLACKVFSLVIFARRPLRLEELTEAVWCLESEPHRELQHKAKPNVNSIRTIVQPFIEFINTNRTDDSCTEEQYTCRILHSTLRDFLVDHPNILCDNSSDLRISAEWPARACLRYLGQSRYSGLLVRQEGRWLDAKEDPVDCHPLLVYAAKYWDKHLDDVTIDIGSIESFITSPNFRTCIQVQSLWVEAQFSFFSRPDEGDGFNMYVRRVFPSWFARAQTGPGQRLWTDFRQLLHEWIYFLSCEQCGGEKTCEILPYIGQLDRIWFGALGPNNFLSQLQGRCMSFAFQKGFDSDAVQYVFDAVSEAGDKIMILRIQATSEAQNKQTIQLTASSCNWNLYAESAGRAAPAAFGADCQTLRIGTQLYRRADNGTFVAITAQHFLCDLRSIYVEEFAYHRQFLVLTSRAKISKRDLKVTWHKADGADSEGDGLDEDLEDEADSIETASDSEDSGDESISEGSTDSSANSELEDDILPPWANHFGDEDTDTDNESCRSFDIEDCNDISDHEEDLESSSDEEDAIPSEVFDDNLFRSEEQHDWEGLSNKRAGRRKARATITFLVVWPLADGNVLFVDYLAKTHFTRRLQPSTPYTGHVFMKIRFSECGEFLHIATLEAHRKTSESKKDSEPLPPIKLAVLLCTYRLSQRKTTRSPPQQIHRMKLALGQTTRLHVSKMPFTLTWTSKDLYFSCSGKSLQVYRIPLFSTTEEKAEENPQAVWTPRKPFFLPHSANNRAVYYFPPAENKSGKEQLPARILIGSDFTALRDIGPNEAEEDYNVLLVKRVIDHSVGRRGEFHPPIGCYVDEDTNLGGWVESHARANILQDRGVGHLDPRMPVERFNPDDDCDYVFDVLMTRDLSRGHVLDLNPYAPQTDSLLFTYEELLSVFTQRSSTPGLRIIDSFLHAVVSRNAPAYQHNVLPMEALALSSGQDIEDFSDLWKNEIQQSMHDDD